MHSGTAFYGTQRGWKELLVSIKYRQSMKIIVDAKDYNLQEDKRLLIPYMEEESRYGIDLVKFGLVDKQGNVVLEAKYDFIIGDSVEPNDIIVLGVIDSVNKKIPYTTNAYARAICLSCASSRS